jgi:hypothetical protein
MRLHPQLHMAGVLNYAKQPCLNSAELERAPFVPLRERRPPRADIVTFRGDVATADHVRGGQGTDGTRLREPTASVRLRDGTAAERPLRQLTAGEVTAAAPWRSARSARGQARAGNSHPSPRSASPSLTSCCTAGVTIPTRSSPAGSLATGQPTQDIRAGERAPQWERAGPALQAALARPLASRTARPAVRPQFQVRRLHRPAARARHRGTSHGRALPARPQARGERHPDRLRPAAPAAAFSQARLDTDGWRRQRYFLTHPATWAERRHLDHASLPAALV